METADEPQLRPPFSQRWFGRLTLLLLGVGLLTAAFAPANQFYLAWIGLVPWFIVLHGTRTQRSAFFWSWISGTFFFIANMWWMAKVTIPGMIALMAVLGLYWGVAGMILRGASLLRLGDRALLRCVLMAAVWVAVGESFRGIWPWNGLPWLYLGYTQAPILPMCQIADVTGVLGVSFLVAVINAWIAIWVLNRWSFRGLRSAGLFIISITIFVVGYGVFRMSHETLFPGPKVLVVQPNYPQDNSGSKGATADEILSFHAAATEDALKKSNPDLTVWSETIMPPLNPEAKIAWAGWNVELYIDKARDQIGSLASKYHSAFLTGGEFQNDFTPNSKGVPEPSDKRNATFFFNREGRFADLRYDKIHLVPFGEFIPFKEGLPPLYRLMVYLGPEDMKSYFLHSGSEDHLTVFPLALKGDGPPWKFVTPICFEDIDPALCAKMFRPDPSHPEPKRADFLVNVTNDGWFLANENYQHFQAAIFRSIENRVSTARSVNTGISGFIDPLGRASGLLPARTEGTSADVLLLDSRITFFTRHGQVFALICAAVASLVVLKAIINLRLRRAAVPVPNKIVS